MTRRSQRSMLLTGESAKQLASGERLGHVHKQIAEVAKAAAAELYETVMGDNLVYSIWRSRYPNLGPKALQRKFVEKNWGKCVGFAKTTMAHMLTLPTIDEKMKEDIMEVLILDGSLLRGRGDVGLAASASTVLKTQASELQNEIIKENLNA